jgi:2,3-bisphosphoglycerate-independent phosphoglycerate mutase
MKTKLIFLIGDGMGDRPVDSLDGKTPLEAAETSAMDALAAQCCAGVAHSIPDSMPPGSDVANMSILGFDPEKHHTGRGPIEAAAMGLDLGPDDLAYRLNLVVVEDFGPRGIMRDYSGGHIGNAQAHAVIELLREKVQVEGFEFHPGVSYRHILVHRGGASRPEAGVELRPPHDITDAPIGEDFGRLEGNQALFEVVTASHRALAEHMPEPAVNAVWPWGQGRALILPDFQETYGLKGAVITAVDLVRGLGRAANMRVLDVPGATGLLDTDYEGKVQAALDFLGSGGEFVYLHVEAPDECGHSGVCEDKIEAIRRFDSRIVAPVTEALGDEAAIMVTCDHYTPLEIRTHSREPVPFALRSGGCAEHALPGFSERAALGTGLTVAPGHELMGWALRRIGS